MATQIINNYREGADVVGADTECKKKSLHMLEELGLPSGLFPLENIEEFGYNRNAGFIWFVQRKEVKHTFKKIKQVVSYATEVTAFVAKGKLTKITGVKTRELLLWFSVVEVYIEEGNKEKVTFKTGTGLSETFDVSAFEI